MFGELREREQEPRQGAAEEQGRPAGGDGAAGGVRTIGAGEQIYSAVNVNITYWVHIWDS